MPVTREISKEVVSGRDMLENGGIKLDCIFKCTHFRQTFLNGRARELHLKFECSTAIAKRIISKCLDAARARRQALGRRCGTEAIDVDAVRNPLRLEA